MEKYSLDIQGKELSILIDNFAEQANGSALIRFGETVLLATAVMSSQDKENLGFFPLTVDYEERYYAAGKIRGVRYTRREGRPPDEAILVSRLIDRSIRPRFPKNIKREVQVILTCLSWDAQNDPDVFGLIGASCALSISDIPWNGPVAAVRVGRIDDKFVLNPAYEEREKSQFDLVLAGKKENGEIVINMIEAGFDEVNEDLILEAVEFAKPWLAKICDFQEEIVAKIGKDKASIKTLEQNSELDNEIKQLLGDKLKGALFAKDKIERKRGVDFLKEEVAKAIEQKFEGKSQYFFDFFDREIDNIIHREALENEARVDGRKLDEIREIRTDAAILPRTHGSGFFSRGQTKSLSILTLGAPGDQQLLEGMEIVGKKRFMHHYNFPPYSVGEVRPLRGPGRRDIGHGILAEKALLPLIPNVEEFPYTIRIVSETLSSNGSSSMASVCASSLALMDAGVPIKRPVAGIAIGLIEDEKAPGKNFKILADIQGPEDHHGDMDFKVAGTREGVTAIQMDVKIKGITSNILKEALQTGKKVRFQILDQIEKTLPAPRANLSKLAPRILTLQINPDKIREVIGPGGKVINEIINQTGAAIDIEQTGFIFITGETEESAQKALQWIENLTHEVKQGEQFEGIVKRIMDFGAFVEILPGQEGLIHISKLSKTRVNKVEDVVKIGDSVRVEVIEVDNLGRINLALKQK